MGLKHIDKASIIIEKGSWELNWKSYTYQHYCSDTHWYCALVSRHYHTENSVCLVEKVGRRLCVEDGR